MTAVLENYRGQRVTFHAEDPPMLIAAQNEDAHESVALEAEVAAIGDSQGLSGLDITAHIAHLSTAEGLYQIERLGPKVKWSPPK